MPESREQADDQPCSEAPMHFCHLGRNYFIEVFLRCRQLDCWPLRSIGTGAKGALPYKNHPSPRQINWMAIANGGKTCTNQNRYESYNRANLICWPEAEIAKYFNIDLGFS